ncbi:MAG: radical SAM protein [Sulfurimonas sp.]
MSRKHLNAEEIEKEAIEIAKTGIKHILLLTGEAEGLVSLEYLGEAVEILKRYFASVTIEVYPMEVEHYAFLKEKGVDGLTVYQETYDEKTYKEVHLSGKKADYHFRLDTPERGAMANLRAVNIGPLYGLSDMHKEAFLCGMHVRYLTNKYPHTEFGLSLPRINHSEGDFEAEYQLDDATFVQFMLAFRLFLPRTGINISTREKAEFRDHLLGLGVTKFSAGSKTAVGGYAEEEKSTEQFETSDKRSTEEIVAMVKSRNYQVIYKDWEQMV